MKEKRAIFISIGIGLIALFCLLPAVIVFFHSFMRAEELYEEFHFFPKQWSLESYESVLLLDPEYYRHFWNSVFYTAGILLLGLPICLLSGYGFSQFHFKGQQIIFIFYIIMMLLPFQATLVPQYLSLKQMNLLGTELAVILPNVSGAFGTILMTQYMKGIDKELLDAGRVDGLSGFPLFLKLVLPLTKPAVSAWFVLAFLDCWGMIEQPNIFLKEMSQFPLSLRLSSLSSKEIFAGSVIFAILPLIIFFYKHDSMIEGISLGSIK